MNECHEALHAWLSSFYTYSSVSDQVVRSVFSRLLYIYMHAHTYITITSNKKHCDTPQETRFSTETMQSCLKSAQRSRQDIQNLKLRGHCVQVAVTIQQLENQEWCSRQWFFKWEGTFQICSSKQFWSLMTNNEPQKMQHVL